MTRERMLFTAVFAWPNFFIREWGQQSQREFVSSVPVYFSLNNVVVETCSCQICLQCFFFQLIRVQVIYVHHHWRGGDQTAFSGITYVLTSSWIHEVCRAKLLRNSCKRVPCYSSTILWSCYSDTSACLNYSDCFTYILLPWVWECTLPLYFSVHWSCFRTGTYGYSNLPDGHT